MTTIVSSRLKDLAVNERPQERLDLLGPDKLSDTELLAMLLRSGTARWDVLSLSAHLLKRAGSLSQLINWGKEDFASINGIGPVKALQLVAVMEMARRVIRGEQGKAPLLSNPKSVFDFALPITVGLEVEKFWTLCLNRKNRLLQEIEVTSGTASSSLVHPREVFKEAIRTGASAIIVCHNHPSGDPSPSQADIQVTRKLKAAAKIVDIDLIDHVIIGNSGMDPRGKGFYSFKDSGFL